MLRIRTLLALAVALLLPLDASAAPGMAARIAPGTAIRARTCIVTVGITGMATTTITI